MTREARSPPSAPVRWAILILAYASAVTWLTWPLARHIGTHLPHTTLACRCDALYSAWAQAWLTHAFTGGVPLANANVFFPAPRAFFYGPGAFGSAIYFAPIFLATGNPTAATNLAFLLGLLLTGLGTHWVVHRWTDSHLAGVVGAATVLSNQWLVWRFGPSTPHMAMLQYLPLVAYAAARPLERLSEVLVLAALIAVQSLTDPVYVAPAMIGPLGLVAAVALCRRGSRRKGLLVLAALAVALLALLPVYWPYIGARGEITDLARQTPWPRASRRALAANLGWPEDIFPQDVFDPMRPTAVSPTLLVLVGLGAAAAVLPGRRSAIPRGAWATGMSWALVGLVMSLSPVVRVGKHVVWLPQYWVQLVYPIYDVIRVEARLGTAFLIGIALLAGTGFAEIEEKVGRWRRPLAALGLRLAFAAAVVVLALHSLYANTGLGKGFPLQRAPVVPPKFAAVLATRPGPLLELPLGMDGVGAYPHARAMFRSIGHWWPLLNGYSSYWPDGFHERMRIALRLPRPDAVHELATQAGLRTIWVHVADIPVSQRLPWLLLASTPARAPLRLIAREGPDLLFAVDVDQPRTGGRAH